MGDLPERVHEWARRRPARIAGHNPWELAVRVARESVDDRLGGLAAEMAFFALLSLVPLLLAVGAALGYLRLLIDPEQLQQGRDLVIAILGGVFSSDVRADVIEPLVDSLLFSERGAVALTSFAVTLWLASRVFVATIRALDVAYDAEETRGALAQRGLALLLAAGFVVVVVVTLGVMVVGPLLGGLQRLAVTANAGGVFAQFWAVARWPVLAAVVMGFLTLVYRYGPARRLRWRACVPGAVLGLVLWLLASLALRLYLAVAAPAGGIDDADVGLALLGRLIGGVVAVLLWLYVTAAAVLAGGELNAELAADAARRARAEPDGAAG